jgi:SAM-dependent methyltransferase
VTSKETPVSSEQKPKTSDINGRLWGARANDWANIQEGNCRPVYEAILTRTNVSAGTDYLDVGCGAGMAAQLAAQRGARVSGLDAAENLLAIARTRVPTGDFRTGELEELPFAEGTFDVVTGFNSFQYAGNPSVALAQANRVAKRGASIAIVTWGEPEGMEAASLLAALRPLLPSPPPGAPGPFALSEEVALRAFAAAARLTPIEVFDVDSPWYYPDLAIALRGLKAAGVTVRAMENSGEEAVDKAHTDALEPFRQSDGSYRIGATFRCLLTHA